MRIERRERRTDDVRQWLAGLAAVLLIGVVVASFHRAGVPVCAWHRLTGLPCLTCGSTRAAAALLAGDPCLALRLQPLMVVGGAAALAALSAYSWCLLARRRVVSLRLGPPERRLAWAVLAVLVALNWAYLVWLGV